MSAARDTAAGDRTTPRDRILLAVAAIPDGRVATYGGVARAAGLPGCARLVARVLSSLPSGSRIPWYRVVAAGGRIAIRSDGAREQIARLHGEGVLLRAGSKTLRVDLRTVAWETPP